MEKRCTYCGGNHPTSLCPHTYAGSSAAVNLHCTYCGSKKHNHTFCPLTYAGESNRRMIPNGEFKD